MLIRYCASSVSEHRCWYGTAHNALVGYHGTVVKDICGSNN